MSFIRNKLFCYGVFTNFSLEVFDPFPFLKTIVSSYTQKVFSCTSLVDSSIEFEFETDRNLYLDLLDLHLSLKLLFILVCLKLSKKKSQNTSQNQRMLKMRNQNLS